MRCLTLSFALGLLLSVAGCKNDTACDDKNPCLDGSTSWPDLTMSMNPADLATPPDMTRDKSKDTLFATNHITLPSSMTPFVFDYDGSGKGRNQLKSILSAVGAIGGGFDPQKAVDDAVKAGLAVALLDVQTLDLTTTVDVRVDLQSAAPRGPADPPKWDGTDVFKVQPGAPAAKLQAHIEGGVMGTTLPSKLPASPVERFSIGLPLLAGAPAVTLVLYGVHVQGSVDAKGIMQGELHGVVRKKDIDSMVVPQLATAITLMINSDPMSSTSATLVGLFEDLGNPATQAKCKVATDCCQKPENRKTCKILPEEVSGNALVSAILAPDVQVFDGDNWKPVVNGGAKDALTVGVGFTAVPASY